jgi:hypothetical protein
MIIREDSGMANPGMYRSKERLYVNRDRSKVVPESSPEAAFVLCGENGEIPMVEAERYGLTHPEPSPSPAVEPAPEDSPPPEPEHHEEAAETKAEQPKDDKAVKPSANKAR